MPVKIDVKPQFVKTLGIRLLFILFLIPLWIVLRSLYRDRIGAFGCFDDCFNYVAGYFLIAGRRLYSEIFFNHQPIPAYLSMVIQYITKPDSLYMLVYQHRMMLIYYFILADTFLILRFGLVGLGFTLLYETTKGFIFGERFLAEAMIVYPLVYLFGLVWRVFQKKKIYPLDLIVAAVASWFVVFSREPYVPLALVMYSVLLWHSSARKWANVSFSIWIVGSCVTVFLHPLREYFFNVVTVSAQSVLSQEVTSSFSMFLYPVLIFFGGSWNVFRGIEAMLSGLLLLFSFLCLVRRQYYAVGMVFLVLALADIRPVTPGVLYYRAFHHIQWYGLCIMSVMLFITETMSIKNLRFFALAGGILYTGVVIVAMVSPSSYLYEKVDRQTEFTTNYAQYFVNGQAVRLLADGNDTLFLDEWDDLIYWQAKRFSSYPYSWYTSVMPQFPTYRQARDHLLSSDPPTFYYGKCTEGKVATSALPNDFLDQYERLYVGDKPGCLFVLKAKTKTITSEQWKLLAPLNLHLPSVTMF